MCSGAVMRETSVVTSLQPFCYILAKQSKVVGSNESSPNSSIGSRAPTTVTGKATSRQTIVYTTLCILYEHL